MTDRYYGVSDNAMTVLTVAMNASQTTATVSSGAVFTGVETPFIITIADQSTDLNMEKMLVTSIAGNVLTVTRGYQSTAISHGNGSGVTLRVVAKHIQDLIDNAVVQLHMTTYLEHIRNGTNQVTQTDVWETAAKIIRLATITYTYADSFTRLPSTATRTIYKGDGTTVRKTESSTFTYVNQQLTNLTRTVT